MNDLNLGFSNKLVSEESNIVRGRYRVSSICEDITDGLYSEV